jgi:hypothetical protein
MRLVKFYKSENRWYAFLSDFIEQGGSEEECEMVSGADVFIDILSQGSDEVFVELSSDMFEGAEQLKLKSWDELFPENGATYTLQTYKGIDFNMDMWLCNVTLFVFGYYPSIIYFK